MSNPGGSMVDIQRYINPALPADMPVFNEAPPLLIRFGALGDMILTTPLLRALAARHGQPCDLVGLGGFVPEILANLPFVQSIRTIESNKTPYLFNRPKKRLTDWLRTRAKGPVYLVQSDVLSHRTLARAGIVPDASDLTVERRVNEHVVDHMARMAGFTDRNGDLIPSYDRGTELRVSDDDARQMQHVLERLGFEDRDIVVVQPGFRKCMNRRRREQKGKFWAESNWIRLIREVLNVSYDKRVIIIGSAAEKPLTGFIADQVNDCRVTDLAGLNLRMTSALLDTAHSMISLDTGPAHAAAALNCPLIVLFGKSDPRVIGPISRSSPVVILTAPADAPLEDDETGWARHHRLDVLSVDTVLAAWTANLL